MKKFILCSLLLTHTLLLQACGLDHDNFTLHNLILQRAIIIRQGQELITFTQQQKQMFESLIQEQEAIKALIKQQSQARMDLELNIATGAYNADKANEQFAILKAHSNNITSQINAYQEHAASMKTYQQAYDNEFITLIKTNITTMHNFLKHLLINWKHANIQQSPQDYLLAQQAIAEEEGRLQARNEKFLELSHPAATQDYREIFYGLNELRAEYSTLCKQQFKIISQALNQK